MSEAYKQAGVDVGAGYESVKRMKKHIKRTERQGIMGTFGGFGGMFDLSMLNMKEPVLVSGTDGVGTKLMLAFEADRHDTIGVDAVAMCVNDILAQGAEPLYFLDYIATGKADPARIEQIVKGVSDGCVEAGSALIGGETAEMPGMYDEDEYDLAGFAVGAVEKANIVTNEDVKEGDVLIALPSSGVHSNGFSLVRKLIADHNLNWHRTYEPFHRPLIEELLTPTRIYVRDVLPIIQQTDAIKGMAHITGGGLYENIPRMLPDGLSATIAPSRWERLPIFSFLKDVGQLADHDLYGTFNMGIGFVMAVQKEDEQVVLNRLEGAVTIGEVTVGDTLVIQGVNS
ncbi:phosphoribosylformylglycinamidine cyclo-ligase [Geomicrobium sp. JCM 19039]|uniref:phosphoribosylformylglycinamidine cyclo-ligase n=1 Tax=Geomicrobium sp. JCM 19039 TaxID=1460636 RepID=UPI00045F2892|nr:phosphoribosylformylglycinamidine cyclo-ligase [Geomicrobium sp. JCM 19039]GAK13359.1 phosphoribosylformylglycinamidine cyclo-ligase [Geomicrobium sp. JCM 19039]